MGFRGLVLSMCIIAALIAGCAGIMRPSKPVSDAGFRKVVLRRVVVPAFSDEAANRWVRVTVRFLLKLPDYGDLPDTYRSGWIRFLARDSVAPRVISKNFVVPREQSDMITGLRSGEYIDVFAFCVPVTMRKAKTGKTKEDILFEVSKIKRTGRGSLVEKPPPYMRKPIIRRP
ncbi:MAG: hypothetical protein JRH00_17185 [Deltaproteobacteria bacterium]|nr:hypothetical protein [Deltaproteobacteria bacterium]